MDSSSGFGAAASAEQKRDMLRSFVAEVIRRRESGESVPDSVLLERRADLLPELEDELQRLRVVESAVKIAERLTPNEVVPGYQLLDELGQGGQAVVYQACRVGETNARYAVKLLHASKSYEPRHLQRLEREAAVLRGLDHPLIVKVHAAGVTAAGTPYLVMERVAGHPLQPELAARLPLGQRVALLASIALTVGVAHSAGVVHRDLKPSNILLDAQGRPYIVDFGMASQPAGEMRNTLTTTGAFVGTYLWASPEQAKGDGDLTPAADVYALGVLLHQLITGGRFPPEVYRNLRKVLEPGVEGSESDDGGRSRPEPAAGSLIEDPVLAAIVHRCLEPHPADRYSNATLLADDLNRYLSGRMTNAKPAGRGRWGVRAAVIGAVVAAVLIPAGVMVWRGRSQPQLPVLANGRPAIQLLDSYPMVWIPPGKFMMGAAANGQAWAPDEPVQAAEVTTGFYMLTTEVRQELYEQVMGSNPSRAVRHPDYPVESVTWEEAMEFCRRLSEKTGRRVRLPTEVEWEYACRAGTNTTYSFGEDADLLLRYGNGADQSNTQDTMVERSRFNDGYPRTALPAHFLANGFHLYDMHGNVWEWTSSEYQINPLDPATKPSGATRYVARGGSWWDTGIAHRSANRNPLLPDSRVSTLGFRVVMDE